MLDRLGQLFIIGLEGKTLSANEASFISKNNIGGVILFARNVESPQQVHKLCSDVQNLRSQQKDKAPLFIGIDMEGGRVARLKAPFTQWPPLAQLGALDSTSAAFKFALGMGAELRAVGINLDFAPCVDVLTNPKNTVIGDRAISTDPEQVAKISSALVRGYIKSNVLPCAKHFPGHGNTLIDSHEELPVENATLEELEKGALIPFKKAFRARLDMVMTAHIKFKNIDPDFPVTLSKKFLQTLLRGEMRYRNLIITDDLDMKALSKYHSVEDLPVMALQAGCDMLLYCNEMAHPPRALEAVKKAVSEGKIPAAQLEESLKRVLALKKEKLLQPDPPSFQEASKVIGHPDHLKLAKGIAEGHIPEELLNT
jgi:beta-N-acetylhexosaminidase